MSNNNQLSRYSLYLKIINTHSLFPAVQNTIVYIRVWKTIPRLLYLDERCGEGLSEPEFYGDLVYKFKKLIGRKDFSFQFRKIITLYRRIGYNLNVMRQSACLVFNPIMVDSYMLYAAFLNCTLVGLTSDSMMAPT